MKQITASVETYRSFGSLVKDYNRHESQNPY